MKVSRAVIKLENCFSWLSTDDENISKTLWRALRFRARNYFHSPLYKQKKWDGYDEFFKLQSGRFLTGLLPEVEAALKVLHCEYVLRDFRGGTKFRVQQVDREFLLPWNPYKDPFLLHDYQCDLTNQLIKYKRGLIQAPTSAGKTAIMLAILKALHETTPVLVLANKSGLSEQNYNELVQWGFPNVGRMYDKYVDPNIITCANIQSVHKLERLLPKIKVLMVDEIHDLMSKVPRRTYNQMKACDIRVGISATPFKYGGKDKTQKYAVKGYFGPVLKTKSDAANEKGVLTTKKLQERGQLSGANGTFFHIREPMLSEYTIYQDAVTQGIAENFSFHQKVQRLATALTGRTLIVVERLAHGDHLKDLMPNAVWIRGEDNLETRAHVIDMLKKSKEDIVAIATQGIFNTGINVFIHNLINAAGGQAEHVIIQRFGRGLRTASDKAILNYFDFVFHINEYLYDHSKQRIRTLIKEGHTVNVAEFEEWIAKMQAQLTQPAAI